ncbi:MAG TPA: transposase [Gaiellaceae bacterium]|nr:transposase [Gaiellaceae bacterium]
MGHPLRLIDPEARYHVVARGNNREPIVRDAIDRRIFRIRLAQIAEKHELEFNAWCLMTTHAHFVLRSRLANVSSAMQELLSGHARTINRRHGRTGHLFQNRFFSVELASDAHLISSIAYVNRNPYAAYAVEDPADWRDSSYRATMGLEPAPAWLDVGFVLGLFSDRLAAARAELETIVRSGRVPVSDTLDLVKRFEERGLVVPTMALATT